MKRAYYYYSKAQKESGRAGKQCFGKESNPKSGFRRVRDYYFIIYYLLFFFKKKCRICRFFENYFTVTNFVCS